MDKQLYTKLEGIMQEFNESIKRNIQNGKPRTQLEDTINNLIAEYQRKFESLFLSNMDRNSHIPPYVKTQILDYIRGEFSNLKNQYLSRTIDSIAMDTSSSLINLNKSELNSNLDTLSQSKASDETKAEELDKQARHKENTVEQKKLEDKQKAQREAAKLVAKLEEIYTETCKFSESLIRRTTNGKDFMFAISQIQAIEQYAPRTLNSLNSMILENYKNALTQYPYVSYDKFIQANIGYKHKIFEAAGLEMELSKSASSPVVVDPFEKNDSTSSGKDSARTSGILRNPFEDGITDETRRKIEEIGTRPPTPPAPEEKKKMVLRSDFLL